MKKFAFAALAAALFSLSGPVRAQETPPTIDRAAAEAAVAEMMRSALQVCVTDNPDVAALEARAAAEGWPAFTDAGAAPRPWRIVNLPPGDRVVLSFGVSAADFPGTPAPITAFTCKLIVAAPLEPLLRQSLATRFGSEDGRGFFMLENGGLRPLTPEEILVDFPQALANLSPQQRLVVVTTETRGEAVIGDVTIFHRRPA